MDNRRTIGSVIEAKACHVTSLAECARRYGAQKSTKYVEGVIVDIIKSRNSSCSRTKTMITADFSLGGGTVKRATLNVRSIRSVTATEEGAEEDITSNINNTTNHHEMEQEILVPAPINEYNPVTGVINQIIHVPPLWTRREHNPPDILLDNIEILNNEHNNDDNSNEIAPINTIIDQPVTNQPVSSPHGYNWYEDEQAIVSDINGTYNTREWGLKTPIGDILRAESNVNKQLSRLDVFYLMFPPSQLDVMVRCTNNVMRDRNKKTTTKGEMLKFLGIIVLMTRYEFKSLW
jgi:Transposase IS4